MNKQAAALPVVLWDGRIDLHGERVAGLRRWRQAPSGLSITRQLAARGLRPGKQELFGKIVCRRGRRWAWLYRDDLVQPKRQPSEAVLAALGMAMAVRRRCPECGEDAGYCIPWKSLGKCVDCWLEPDRVAPIISQQRCAPPAHLESAVASR